MKVYFSFFFYWLISSLGNAFSSVDAQLMEEPHALFQPNRVSEITLRFSEQEWRKLQPSADLDWDVGSAFNQMISDASRSKSFRVDEESRPGLGGYL